MHYISLNDSRYIYTLNEKDGQIVTYATYYAQYKIDKSTRENHEMRRRDSIILSIIVYAY
jgi:hypothetical protein